MVQVLPISVGGLTRFSTVDYPGHLAAVVFCQGCPWRCVYCHNPHLQSVDASAAEKRWPEVVDWLKSRRGLLDSVVFSGGEPLLQPGLGGAMWQVRSLGYELALHTAGMFPKRLAAVLPLVDWIGFDIKAPFSRYEHVTGAQHGDAVRRSLAHLMASKKPCQIRVTVDESLLTTTDASEMGENLAHFGVRKIVLQRMRRNNLNVPITTAFVDAISKSMDHVELR